MVHNVVLDDAMEHVAADEAKVTVDGGGGALDESPVLGLVMRGLLVGVVKIGDGNYNNQFSVQCLPNDSHTNPVVHPEVRQTVGKRDSPAANIGRCGV